MVKKKMSGQTIVIIILAVLLVLTLGFGGVYAFYSAKSNKISGKIMMATLNISMVTNSSDKSEIVISNGVNVVPGQQLNNSPLIVNNSSSASIYLVVVYRIEATKEENNVEITVTDNCKTPVLGLGLEYINSIFTSESTTKDVSNTDWIDFLFKANDTDSNAQEIKINEDETCRGYRCLVSTVKFAPPDDSKSYNEITVIGENKLSLAGAMGNDYQSSTISFTFQAYAIGSESGFGFVENETKAGRCEKIVNAIYESQDGKFLNINTAN